MRPDAIVTILISFGFFGTVIYTVTAIARAAAARRKETPRVEPGSSPSVSEARFARMEQAIEAIALEVERISEGQRFTTRLLSEQTRLGGPKPVQRQISHNTPT